MSVSTKYRDQLSELKEHQKLTKQARDEHAKKAASAIKQLQRSAKQAAQDLPPAVAAVSQTLDELEQHFTEQAQAAEQALRQAPSAPDVFSVDLNRIDWQRHDFRQELLATAITSGREQLYQFNDGEQREVPRLSQLLSVNRSYVVGSHDDSQAQAAEALGAMHERVCRLTAMMPHSAKFTFIDKQGLGANFIYQSSLPRTRHVSADLQKTLEEIMADIERINRSFTMQVQSLLQFDESIRRDEGFEFIMVANFPEGLERRNIEALARIAENGPRCGKYVFLQLAPGASYPSGVSLKNFKNAVRIGSDVLDATAPGRGYVPVTPPVMQAIFDGAKAVEKQASDLSFDQGTQFSNDLSQWWQDDPTRKVSTPVGGSGAKKNDLQIWFGEGQDSVCAHGMLGATTGAGKSNLYHTFILGLACRYSPQDLQFYLVDGKQGVEFDAYRQLPHARVVSLYTSPQLARSVLQELVDTMERRNTLFTEHGVASFAEYRKAGEPGGKMARLIAVVDEYQTFFEDDRDGEGSELMLKLVSQSRSAGIHLFVGSQRFNVAGMQKQQAIFGNMHLRVGMKMTAADITALNEFQSGGKTLLRACKEVGQAVINDSLGDDSSNLSGRIFRMQDETRKTLLAQLQQKWQQTYPETTLEAPVILNGSEQPKLLENPQLLHALKSHAQRPDAAAWQAFAQLPEHLGGLGATEWYPVERPRAFWLGKKPTIYGQQALVMRCRTAENVLFIGDNAEARVGMLALLTAQLAVAHAAAQVQVFHFDGAIEGSPWHGVVHAAAQGVGLPLHELSDDQLASTLTELVTELERRRGLNAAERAEQPLIYVVLNDIQRCEALQMQEGRFGDQQPSAAGQQLQLLLQKGAELGLHLLVAADTLRGLLGVLEKSALNHFRHKVALQMTDDDSFKLLNGRQAAKLQAAGPKPIYALYVEEMQNRQEQFKPYAFRDLADLQATCTSLRDALTRWER
ncbi:FtsK/SpoIIIE domain-containing protein [Pseudidiomarina sediminum]|uniref:FtsK/SpoIIIE domain-containing protein n=1 Tax=Pseudidiomarina sediminum TaxID=431675 RepID=UPI001C96C065|nr:FtsK/SpoIIIE domain-containing protein [Pseudidiomarina sediminum]MBY6063677.1 hypothetical protein [Pseudidiomarina sediminum]